MHTLKKMVQSKVHQEYNLSVVSGGKPILPRGLNSFSSQKSIACLTADQLNFIVPFNNQIKIYSVETRQAVKTIKFSNNQLLSDTFQDSSTYITHIILGDIFSVAEGFSDKLLSVFTNTGDVMVLNYKGKLVDAPKHLKIELEENENILKVFEHQGTLKLLSVDTATSQASMYKYKIYNLTFNKESNTISKELVNTLDNVILSSWSQNDRYLSVLQEQDSKRIVHIQSIFDNELTINFPLASILPSRESTLSTNARYVSTMAISNDGSQIALGFASGVINLVSLPDLQSRLLKWHIDTVLSLAFTHDGSYLISGGWEKVVSFWQLSTNMQQFLPRLNGVIVDCQVLGDDKYYAISLQLTENNTNSDFQILLISSSDLTSRLSITGPLPVFDHPIEAAIQPLSAVTSKSSTTISKAREHRKKQKRKLLKGSRYDFTAVVEVDPLTRQLYFPHKSAIQIYDFYKNEQVSYQHFTTAVSSAMGKVRNELNIQDPEIVDVKFTKDGAWMITYEIEYSMDGLLSSNDHNYSLKFWTKKEGSSEWILRTKVVNPHGKAVSIRRILSAPHSINNSQGLLTADSNGGLKYWSYVEHEKNWCLTKILLPNLNHHSTSVTLAWSQDGSLIFQGIGDKITILDFDTFRKFNPAASSKIVSEFSLDSEIQSLCLVHDTLLAIVTKTVINVLNLLSGKIENSFDLYPYIRRGYKSGNFGRLVACDEETGRIAIAINESIEDDTSLKFQARIAVFEKDLSCVSNTFMHDKYISWLGWNHGAEFIFIDTDCRLGVVGTTVNSEIIEKEHAEGIADDGYATYEFGQSLAQLVKDSSSALHGDDYTDADAQQEYANGEKHGNTINMNSFTNMFENIQDVQMTTMFERVMTIIG